ncbi:restriction endonuclease subunit S [Thiolapillus sp.]|uniref:restriction endonuclease subunit S n=6 Tax=Thiolapillus sp. TaxID=2017437 RepID=UPI003AF4FECD
MAGEASAVVDDKGWLYHPYFPDHWKRCPLYSLAQWVNGLAFRNIQFSDSGLPVIKIAEIKGGISGQTKFTRQTFDDAVRVRYGDLLFSWSGQPETSIDAFWWRDPEGWLNQHIFRVTPTEGIDPVFFYYLLRYLKPNFVGIARNKQTTGLGHITKRDLENLEAAYPRLPEQRAIAHILGSLDDKIELNRQMAQTLESIARAIFKSWFVDFDPVKAKMEGKQPEGMTEEIAALFPDRLVDSELGMIPEGWSPIPLSKMANFLNGLALQKYPPIGKDDLPVLKIAQLRSGKLDYDKLASNEISDKYLVSEGDLIFSWSGSLIVDVWAGPKCALNQHLFKVTPEKWATKGLLWVAIHEHIDNFRAIAAAKAVTMGHIKRSHLNEAMVILPSIEKVQNISGVLDILIQRSTTLKAESNTLINLRDTLLPQLISGKIRLNQPEDAAA